MAAICNTDPGLSAAGGGEPDTPMACIAAVIPIAGFSGTSGLEATNGAQYHATFNHFRASQLLALAGRGQHCKVKVSSYKELYLVLRTIQSTLHITPNRPVHSNINATYVGSIQPHRYNCTKTSTYIHHCL